MKKKVVHMLTETQTRGGYQTFCSRFFPPSIHSGPGRVTRNWTRVTCSQCRAYYRPTH